MQIIVTDSGTKQTIAIEHKTIVLIRRTPGGLLTSDILTGLQGPGGPMALQVLESPDEVGRRVNAAARAESKGTEVYRETDLGFPASGLLSN